MHIVHNQTGMVNAESNLMYVNLNENIEKWSNVFYWVLMKVTAPGILIISFTMSYYLYFTSDLGSDAFCLPYPFWYVNDELSVTSNSRHSIHRYV